MKLKIDPFDKHYELKVADIDKQVEAQYDKMVDLQEAIEECGSRKKNIEEAHLSSQRIYKILVYFDKLYDTMDDKDKQLFFKSLIKEIQIYEEPVGKQWIKSIKFTFPILDGVDEIGLDKEGTVETVNRILSRYQACIKGEKAFYTEEELRALAEIHRNFRISKLRSGGFAWKDYLLPINHFERSVFYYKNGITNFDDKNLQILKNRDIIDVGGFIADSAIIFSDYTNKKVYSFEPSSKNFELMPKTIEMNNKDNIVPVNLGLGSKNRQATIPMRIGSGNKVDQPAKFTENIKITTLDEYVKEHNLDVGLIKVDIEGAEQDFLKGAEQTIKEHKPLLLLSIYHNPSDFFDIKPLIESWNLGYQFKIVKCIDGQISNETLLIGTPTK